MQCLGYNSWHWTIWAGIAYFVERVVREWRSRRATALVGVLMHPFGAMELRFTQHSFKYKAGQWIFLNVPGECSLDELLFARRRLISLAFAPQKSAPTSGTPSPSLLRLTTPTCRSTSAKSAIGPSELARPQHFHSR